MKANELARSMIEDFRPMCAADRSTEPNVASKEAGAPATRESSGSNRNPSPEETPAPASAELAGAVGAGTPIRPCRTCGADAGYIVFSDSAHQYRCSDHVGDDEVVAKISASGLTFQRLDEQAPAPLERRWLEQYSLAPVEPRPVPRGAALVRYVQDRLQGTARLLAARGDHLSFITALELLEVDKFLGGVAAEIDGDADNDDRDNDVRRESEDIRQEQQWELDNER